MSIATLAVYLVGALSFSIGAILAHAAGFRRKSSYIVSLQRHEYCRVVLDFLLIVCVLGLPIFANRLFGAVGGWSNPTALWEIRHQSAGASGQTTTFDPVNNLAILTRFVALGMCIEDDGSTRRTLRFYLALLPAFAYGFISGSKSPIVTLIVTLLLLRWFKSGRLQWKTLVAAVIVCMLSFTAGLRYINYQADIGDHTDTSKRLGTSFLYYWMGAPVAFDRIVRDPNSLSPRKR